MGVLEKQLIRFAGPLPALILCAAVAPFLPLAGAAPVLAAPSAASVSAAPLRAAEAVRRGDYESTVVAWQDVLIKASGTERVHALVQLALAQSALGRLEQAVSPLREAAALAKQHGDTPGLVLAQNSLGGVLTGLHTLVPADAALAEALAAAKKLGDPALTAAVWNNIGSLRVLQERTADAVAAYGKALEGARDDSLRARVNLNLASVASQDERPADSLRFLAEAEKSLPVAESAAKVQLLASLGTGYLKGWKRAEDGKAEWLSSAERVSVAAQALAERLGDKRSISQALGLLGEIAEQRKNTAEAMRLTRRARFFAQQSQAPHLLYQWDWQLGRLLKAQDQIPDAINALRRSITTFRTLCDCSGSGFSYEETIRPLYYQLADLLLQQSGSGGAVEVQNLLSEARATMELLKTAELSDYFQDGCVAGGLSRTRDITTVLDDAAAIYIIPLPDRTEILLGLPGGWQRVTAKITGSALGARARRLRLQLQRPASNGYLAYSRELYDELLKPLESTLQQHGVRTLVLVTDGALRSIPFAVLHDGEKFLAEKYALAVAPGMTLLDPRPLEAGATRVFAGGVSQAVQGFNALQAVPQEIKAIQNKYSGTALLDNQFVKSRIAQEVSGGDFSIVHIASHGEFAGRADNTYLLAYDGKVTLNELEELIRPRQHRGTPVEMLFLSACQTAAGDDRAALGLAGIAIKAGARSAVASLWSVNDEATTALVKHFYAQLKATPGISKARAMQQAQMALMREERYAHPAFWAPFLVIGNWL